MKFAIITILLLAAFSGCTGNHIEQGIRRFLEQFRLDMQCGFPRLGVPVLAPFRRERLPVNIRLGEFAYVSDTFLSTFIINVYAIYPSFSFRGTINNLYTAQMNTFQVRSVRFNMVFMRMDFEFFYPHVTTTGRFTQGVGQSPGNCRLPANGAFTLRANGLTHRMSSRLVVRGRNVQLGEMTSRVTMTSFQSNIQQFVGTPQQSNQCNALLQQHMPRLFASHQQAISRYIESVVRPIAERSMRNMTLQDLLNMININRPLRPCRPRSAAGISDGDDDVNEMMVEMAPQLISN